MGSVAKRRVNEVVNIPEVVRLAMEEFDSDKDKVIRALTLRTRNPDLNDAFRALGIQQAVRSHQGRERHGQIEEPSRGRPSAFAGPRRIATPEEIQTRTDLIVAKKLWWDRVTLFGGNVTLANATRREVFASARAHGGQEQGNRNMREFYEDVGKRMLKADQTVSAQLTIAKVLELAQVHNIIPGG